jgi:hypothetical protein
MDTNRRTIHLRAVLGLCLAAALLLAAACGSDEPEPDVSQHGLRPPPTDAPTTTTTIEVTEDTLPVAVVQTPEPADWSADWPGPDAPVAGTHDTSEFDAFLLENAPAESTPVEAVAAYLQLDPADPDTQMLLSERGGPESVNVIVIQNTQGDDSVRAVRWEFAVEVRDRAFLEAAEKETADAEKGDTEAADEELDSDAGDAADEEQLQTEEGPDTVPQFITTEVTLQCQPGRGHQDFTEELCS